ncbi:MAG: UDP-2,4-diacetamido-2,4,6-trideoxy-beta-L-altropyranose hydrolase [Bacteroidota bacterium]
MKNRVVLRADGNSAIGMGHIFRCLALAEMLKNNYHILFISNYVDDKQRKIITSICQCFELNSADQVQEVSMLSEILNDDDILVVDGYNFKEEYQINIKRIVKKLVVIDDLANFHYYADLVINHGGETIEKQYVTESYTKVLTGFKYLIVRKEFIRSIHKEKTVKKIDTVFICMGGADPFGITMKALMACIQAKIAKNIIVVVGNAYKNIDEIKALIDTEGNSLSVLLEINVNAERMTELIAVSEISICPSSSISLEVCCVKSGLLTGTVIDNQQAINEQLVKNGCAINMGDLNSISIADISMHLNNINSINVVQNIIRNQEIATANLSDHLLLKEFKLL